MSDVEMEVVSPAVAGDSEGELHELVEKFRAAVSEIGSIENVESEHIFEGNPELRDTISTCMRQFLPLLRRILHLSEPKDQGKAVLPSPKNKTWKKIQGTVKTYLLALIQLLSNEDLQELITERLPEIIIYYSCFPKLSKVAMERMIGLWSSDSENVRVIASSCITRLVLLVPPKQVEDSLMRMYSVFCKCCKVTTVKSLSLINCLKHSLVEIMSLKPDLAYKCAFASIKGMAKKLRNASDGHKPGKKRNTKERKVAVKKREKETEGDVKSIYSWQHLNALSFWITLICRLKSDANMQTLVHHVVEIVNDTIRANSSVQYFPLRFSCLRMLIQLCEATELFVPVLPFLIEVIDCSALQTNAAQNSVKQFNFDATLKVLKTEVHEKAFLDETIDSFYELTLQYCACFSHLVAFPELVQTTVQHIKNFIRNCPVSAYTSKMKMLVQKLEEHSSLIKRKRAAANLDLRDAAALRSWEQNLTQEKNPLVAFFEARKKKHLERKQFLVSHEEMVEEKFRTPCKEKRSKTAINNDGDKPELDAEIDKNMEDEVSSAGEDEDCDGETSDVGDRGGDCDDESSTDGEEMEVEDASNNEDDM